MPRSSHPSTKSELSSASSASPLHRLPVNPRRKKVAPDERKRVATACNSCNVRRIKCSGERPCRQCSAAQRECLYPEPVEKVTIPRVELESLQRRCASLERQLAAVRTGDHLADASHVPDSPSASPCTAAGEALSMDGGSHYGRRPGGIDGRMLADSAGATRYLGETSGATFLDTLKELIATATPLARLLEGESGDSPTGAAFLGSVGQYQTHDSRPMLLPPVVDPLALPPEAEIAAALSQIRYFIQDGSGSFASGGILFWPFEDPHSLLALPTTPMQRSGLPTMTGTHHQPLALFHAAFALTRLLNLREPGSAVDGQLGEDYYAKARALLGNLLDRTTYTIHDIAALALMGLYLVENNRRDAAYLAIGNAMTISVMNGLHRGWSGNEVGVRTFWTVYVLDRWLGCVMGRPPTVPDDAITLPLPTDCPGLPSPEGLRAHIQLCSISDYIVYSSYKASGHGPPHLPDGGAVRLENALEKLRTWHATLPASLSLSDPLTLFPADFFSQAGALGQASAEVLSGSRSFGHDRACWALHMSYNQLVILSVRPAMLMAVWKAVASILCIDQPFDIENHPQIEPIRACSDAARRNLRLGRLMRLHSRRQKLMLPDLHNVFNAAIILMMHQVIFVNLRTQDLDDIGWAIEVFDSEAETGREYAKDCARVLKDFKYLAHKIRNPIHDPGIKQALLSNEGVLRDLLPEEVASGLTMASQLDQDPTSTSGRNGESSRHQRRPGDTLYERFAAAYQKLSCWWGADYTFLS